MKPVLPVSSGETPPPWTDWPVPLGTSIDPILVRSVFPLCTFPGLRPPTVQILVVPPVTTPTSSPPPLLTTSTIVPPSVPGPRPPGPRVKPKVKVTLHVGNRPKTRHPIVRKLCRRIHSDTTLMARHPLGPISVVCTIEGALDGSPDGFTINGGKKFLCPRGRRGTVLSVSLNPYTNSFFLETLEVRISNRISGAEAGTFDPEMFPFQSPSSSVQPRPSLALSVDVRVASRGPSTEKRFSGVEEF